MQSCLNKASKGIVVNQTWKTFFKSIVYGLFYFIPLYLNLVAYCFMLPDLKYLLSDVYASWS